MNINGLLKVAEKNKFIPTQKRFSLEFSPPKKLPKTQVNPDAIRALIEKKERERRDERANLISKAVESTRRDEVNYKDRNGLRKAEQEHSEKCKKQWQKVQRDRREFIEHMNKAADRRDQNKKARDAQEVVKSIKSKEQEKDKRKRKYETYTGSTEPAKKPKYTPTVAPKVTDINELMRLAQQNAEEKSFGAIVNPLRELEKKQPAALTERLLTQSEKKKLAEQEALSKRKEIPSIPRIPKVGQSSESHKTNKHKKPENDSRKESSKSSKDKVREKSHQASSSKHSSSSTGSSGASSSSNGRDKHEKPRDKKHSSDKDRLRTSHNGASSSKSNGVSKAATVAQPPPTRKPTSAPLTPNGSLGRPQNGNVAVQSMSSSAKDKLREETAKKLAQLQRERQAEEEEERRKRLLAKKARMAEEQQIKKKLKALQRNQTRLDSEDEEDFDEDLDEYEDDFIDDGPVDDPYAKGYSKHIKEIFNYDKTKYRDVDDDDIEESSFTRCMAEEARSARLGRQEDLEDMRKEAEENRKKDNRSKALKDLSEKLKQKKKLTLCPV